MLTHYLLHLYDYAGCISTGRLLCEMSLMGDHFFDTHTQMEHQCSSLLFTLTFSVELYYGSYRSPRVLI